MNVHLRRNNKTLSLLHALHVTLALFFFICFSNYTLFLFSFLTYLITQGVPKTFSMTVFIRNAEGFMKYRNDSNKRPGKPQEV